MGYSPFAGSYHLDAEGEQHRTAAKIKGGICSLELCWHRQSTCVQLMAISILEIMSSKMLASFFVGEKQCSQTMEQKKISDSWEFRTTNKQFLSMVNF